MAWFVFVIRCSEDRKRGGHLVIGSLSDLDNQTEYWATERLIIFTPHQILQVSARMIWARHVARRRKTKNAYRILVGKRSLLKLFWCGWEDKIRIDLKGSWEGVDWIHLAQDRDNWRGVMQTCGFYELQCISSLAEAVSSSTRTLQHGIGIPTSIFYPNRII